MRFILPLVFICVLFSGCVRQTQESSDRFIKNYTQGPKQEVDKKVQEVQDLIDYSKQQQKSADY